MARAISMIIVLLVLGTSTWAQQFRNAGVILMAETTVTNKVIESGERVTVSFGVKNVGDVTASNLVATIQAGEGVSTPVPLQQNYGVVAPCASAAWQPFTFTASAPGNSLLFVNLDLTDSGTPLGTVTFRFRIGPVITSVTNSEVVEFRDLNKADPYPSVLSVTDIAGTVVNVSATLSNLTHAFPDDLDILLVSPAGDAVMLMSDACGGSNLVSATITFTDQALTVIPPDSHPTSAAHKPANYDIFDAFLPPAPTGPYAAVMSAFNGKSAVGQWKLYVMDDFVGDLGELEGGWSLTITTILPLDEGPALRLLGRIANRIRFEVSGRPGHRYAVESSPDPLQSFPLESFIMPPGGKQTFDYPLEATDRFFRAVTEP